MKRRRDRQHNGPLHALVLCQRRRALDGLAVAGDDDLIRIIVVGDRADLTLGRFVGDFLRFCAIGAEQRRHRPLADRHRGLHRPPAKLEQLRRGRKIDRAGGAQGGIFAQAMPSNEIGLVGKADAGFLL